jgi:hypothetical protein
LVTNVAVTALVFIGRLLLMGEQILRRQLIDLP